MGPSAAGLSTPIGGRGIPPWRLRLEREWGVNVLARRDPRHAEMDLLLGRIEEGLRRIDFPEVTLEDRITYVEHAVSWQVRRALRAGRFDLALDLRSFGARRVGELLERFQQHRPVLLYGVPLDSARGLRRAPSFGSGAPDARR